MRIGIISDVHSNIDALKAVYQEFTQQHVDKIICCGDIIGLGAHPEECIQFIQSIQPQILSIVRGNHENYLLKELPVYDHNDPTKPQIPEPILDLFRWNHSRISQSSVNYLNNLPNQEIIKVEGVKIYNSHYPISPTGGYMPFYIRPDLRQCKKIFANVDADIFLFGHTHIRSFNHTHRHKYYINPGSTGCPIGTDSASAGILTINGRNVHYAQLDVAYDIDKAVKDMLSNNYNLPAIDYTVDHFYRRPS